MGFLLAYILKSSLYVIAFYLFHRLLLSRDTFYRFNRHALLIMLLMSIGLPLVEFSHEVAITEEQVTIELDPMTGISVIEDDAPSFSWIAWGILLYWVGIAFFALKTIISYLSLARILHSSEKKSLDEYGIECKERIHLLVHHYRMSPFSWMNYIVANEEDLQSNGNSIVYHELGHVRHHHTLDLLFTEVCLILHWFNPAIWLMRRELQTIHEYQADEEVLNTGIDARQYQLLLIEKATGTRLQSITCSLHQSSIKKRITMMLKKKSNPWARAKVLFAIPVAIAGIAVFSCSESASISDQISECKVSEIFGNDQILDEENLNQSQNLGNRIQLHSFGNGQYVFLKQKNGSVPEGSKAMTDEELKSEYAQNSHLDLYVPENTEQETVDNAKNQLRKLGITRVSYNASALTKMKDEPISNEGNQVFTICEVQPKFPGGEQAMMEHLKNNLRYPAECANKSIEGRVILSFVVEKDGSVSNIEEMRSPDPLFTEEAKRVVSIMPKWEPGTQRGHKVRVKYVLPVTFRLK